MELSQGSYGSSSNSAFRGNCWFEVSNVPCHCNKPAIIFKSWTNENPGRRFYKCGGKVHNDVSCEFWKWADEEKPHGWQKKALLEARDQIRQQKEELKQLKDELKSIKTGHQKVEVGGLDSEKVQDFGEAQIAFEIEMSECKKKFGEEKRTLENEAMGAKEREKMLRQFVLLSWGGFIVVTALILNMRA